MNGTNWRQNAICWGMELETFFSSAPADQKEAKRICGNCPVKAQCLQDALEVEQGQERSQYAGIRGGLTGSARWALNNPEAAEEARAYSREYKRRNAEKGAASMRAYRLRKKEEAA